MNIKEMNEQEQVFFEHLLLSIGLGAGEIQDTNDLKKILNAEKQKSQRIYEITIEAMDRKMKQIDFLEGGGCRT